MDNNRNDLERLFRALNVSSTTEALRAIDGLKATSIPMPPDPEIIVIREYLNYIRLQMESLSQTMLHLERMADSIVTDQERTFPERSPQTTVDAVAVAPEPTVRADTGERRNLIGRIVCGARGMECPTTT